MKFTFNVLALFLSLAFAGTACAQVNDTQPTTIVLVRHAEKAQDGTDNPSLSEKGQTRALALAFALKEFRFDEVYSTPYKRTRETVAAIAASNQLTTVNYEAHNEAFVGSLLGKGKKTVLISGHSNTIPALVNQLIGEDRFKNLEDWEYDYLFIATLGNDTTLQVLHYGEPALKVN